jgi:hypothetical protein
MRAWFLVLLLLSSTVQAEPEKPVTFDATDVWIDSGTESLAAYQVEIRYDATVAGIVGVEGGETAAFNSAPFYDPAGMEGGHIIVAAFTADDANAPTGRVRVARIHWRTEGNQSTAVTIRLVTAAKVGGEPAAPRVEAVPFHEPKGE